MIIPFRCFTYELSTNKFVHLSSLAHKFYNLYKELPNTKKNYLTQLFHKAETVREEEEEEEHKGKGKGKAGAYFMRNGSNVR
ncbi:hypothetical protein E2C01_071503 [Portunus trituberculatus]|uniref:Uncharacterized protein n=1 Tax=Portunus trituberculatus TaxID=210409 RepID=A0A5B7HX61_PORTR|nr:hypothetical protein [Portunus trituberculatus]